jgi:hypothetical protein
MGTDRGFIEREREKGIDLKGTHKAYSWPMIKRYMDLKVDISSAKK